MYTIWFEKLSVVKLFVAIIARIIQTDISICYPTISTSAKNILNIFHAKNWFLWIYHQELNLGTTTEKGEALRYRAEEYLKIAVDYVFNKYFNDMDKFIPPALRSYSGHILKALQSEFLYRIREKVYFICAVSNLHQKKAHFKQKIPLYWLNYTPLISQLKGALGKKTKGFFFVWPSIQNLLYYPLPLFPLAHLLRFCLHKIKNFSSRVLVDESLTWENSSKTLVEFYGRTYIDNPSSHLFWFAESKIPAERVIRYFDRPDSPNSEQNRNFIKESGMHWLDLSGYSQWLYIDKPIASLFNSYLNVPRPKNLTETSVLCWLLLGYFSFLLQIWRTIFRKYNIKVFHQHQEHNFLSHVQTLAINIEGGISLWFHWSMDRLPFAHYNYASYDIYFSWGKSHSDFINFHEFDYRFIIEVGCIPHIDVNAQRINKIINKFSPKVNFIITIFDTTHDYWRQNSSNSVSYFYETLLTTVLSHPSWGVIIKPKKPNNYSFDESKNGLKIANLLKELTLKKRCLIMDSRTHPILAAASSDICIGCSNNSACAICGIAGYKAINWSLARMKRHFFYLNGKDRIIFEKKEEVIKALEFVAKDAESHSHIGDYSPWLDSLDPYRDGKAGFRAGQFIKTFITHIDEGDDKDTALQKAVKKYEDCWGRDKVYSFEAKNVRLNDNIWIEAEKILRK